MCPKIINHYDRIKILLRFFHRKKRLIQLFFIVWSCGCYMTYCFFSMRPRVETSLTTALKLSSCRLKKCWVPSCLSKTGKSEEYLAHYTVGPLILLKETNLSLGRNCGMRPVPHSSTLGVKEGACGRRNIVDSGA